MRINGVTIEVDYLPEHTKTCIERSLIAQQHAIDTVHQLRVDHVRTMLDKLFSRYRAYARRTVRKGQEPLPFELFVNKRKLFQTYVNTQDGIYRSRRDLLAIRHPAFNDTIENNQDLEWFPPLFEKMLNKRLSDKRENWVMVEEVKFTTDQPTIQFQIESMKRHARRV